MNMIYGALICVFVFWIANVVQKVFLLNMSYSPICLCFLLGLLLGQPREGLIMGGYLQAIFLGVMAIGGVAPANKQLGSIIPCAFVLLGGIELEAGLAIAYTVGVLANTLNNLTTPIFAAAEPWWKKLASEGNAKKYAMAHWVWFLVISLLPQALILFFCVAFGTEGVAALMNMLPAKFMNGLSVASGCLTAVGISIALKMTWQKKFAGFFFVGWILSYVMGLSQLQCAIVAISVGLVWYFVSAEIDGKIKAASGNVPAQRGGEFF